MLSLMRRFIFNSRITYDVITDDIITIFMAQKRPNFLYLRRKRDEQNLGENTLKKCPKSAKSEIIKNALELNPFTVEP